MRVRLFYQPTYEPVIKVFFSQNTNTNIYADHRYICAVAVYLGFADARGTCCRTGTAKTRVYLCNPTTAGTCRNASSYVFFDAVHPSEAANVFLAESMVEAGIELVT